MGQSIYNAHKRVTWLSFWTVSGPLASEQQLPADLLQPRFRGGGVCRGPDRPVPQPRRRAQAGLGHLRPRGLPRQPLEARRARGFLHRHHGGLRNVLERDVERLVRRHRLGRPYAQRRRLRLTVRVSQLRAGQPANAGLRGTRLRPGRADPVAGATGSNMRGFIAFNASCTPTSTLKTQEATLLNPPWAGQFNTLQFNAGVYCRPRPSLLT